MAKWTPDLIPSLKGKTILVTGANSGIGFEATKLFALKGASVIMGCRNIEKANNAKELILSTNKNAKLDIIPLDLSDFDSIEKFSKNVISSYNKIDILLNNAGIMTVPYGKTKQGFELQIGTNHFGHYYLTMLLQDHIHERVVNVASIAHKFGNLKPSTFFFNKGKRYNKYKAYAQSKLANLLFTYKLADKMTNVKVLAAHPGISNTNLGAHLKLLRFKPTMWLFGLFNQSAYRGSLPSVMAATDANANTKDYYGPSGLFEMKGSPKKVKSTKRSRNKELQDLLWKESVIHTKLDFKKAK